MKAIIDNELDNIITDLNYFIGIKNRSDEEFQKIKFLNPVRFSYL